jgi:hypothetical protein
MAVRKRQIAKKDPVVQKNAHSLEPIYQVWGWVLLLWSLYRYFVKLPEWADEFIFKPLVFIGPAAYFVRKIEKRSLSTLGLSTNNFFKSLYIGLGFGFVFAVEGIAANALKYGSIHIVPLQVVDKYGLLILLILSAATAFSEELLTRGFLFSRIYERTKNMPFASLMSTVLFVLLHVPILVTSLKLQGVTLVLFFVTDFILGMANSLLYFNTGTLVAPILVHIFWNLTVALYL